MTRFGSITDVPGVRVGQVQRTGGGWLTGVSVVVPPPGTVGGVDVRGGGPGTHETDALHPTTLVPTVDAVTLCGGSAFGLAAAGGVQRWCEEQGLGFPAGPPEDPTSIRVPIVPAAAIFDLGRGGDLAARPDAGMGLDAARASGATPPPRGAVGAGTGARIDGARRPGGVGTSSRHVPVGGPEGVEVGAFVVLNAAGSPYDPATDALLGTAFVPADVDRDELLAHRRPRVPSGDAGIFVPPATNTTLAVVATNARLDPAQVTRLAAGAQDGIARGVNPAHLLVDGDTVFGLATGEVDVQGLELLMLQAAAADAVLLAVLDAVLESA
ncbi:P1 family peptidase [Spongisporangium articulatum]|uniref:P1 family peptidase n=1 Tax=Spongisporangium articulatum TaxID=3362603 RepID=A0ABW8AQ41_9ACTN